MSIRKTDEPFVQLWKWAQYGIADKCRELAWALEPNRKFNGKTVLEIVSPADVPPWAEEEDTECVEFIRELYALHESATNPARTSKGAWL